MEEKKAHKIVLTLRKYGHTAYYAGGWVRDYLMGKRSSDIDIATSALPEEIVKIFPKTIPVGIQFGIVVVVLDGTSFEVATFRSDVNYQDGRRPEKVVFSSPKKDAERRDFTINGMFFDPVKKEVLDYVSGKKDLENKILRAIGNPFLRMEEDRLRMIRAVRFACSLEFQLEEATKQAILFYKTKLFPAVAIERIAQELRKMAESAHFDSCISMLSDLGLLQQIFPMLFPFPDFEKTLKLLSKIPKNSPFIIKVLTIFPEDYSVSCLASYLKLSNKEEKIGVFFRQAKKLFLEANQRGREIKSCGPKDYELAKLYAHPLAEIAIEFFAVSSKNPAAFLNYHQEKQKALAPFIQRLQQKNPVVKASMLLQLGFVPGKELGEWLQKAEELSINEKIEDPITILQKLKLQH